MTKPRYGYRDTPKGRWREDRKTGEFIWRKSDNPFPDETNQRKKKRKKKKRG